MFFTAQRRRAESARYTERLDIPLSEQMNDQLAVLASLVDVTKTQYARRVLEIHALGALAVSQEACTVDVTESRMGGQSGGGKCTERLDIPVSEELYAAVMALAGLAGRPKADYVRWVLDQHLMGALAYSRARLGQ